MPITCKICSTEFDKIIPWQHLKKHNVTTAEYKEKYGPVYSDETISKMQARVPHNKGKKVTDPVHLENLRVAVQKREEKFRNGEIKRGTPCTIERKQKLSVATKAYAAANPEEMKQRAGKGLKTRIDRGYDLGSNMRGKKHSAESKALISQRNYERYSNFTSEGALQVMRRIESENLVLLSSVKKTPLELKCNTCNTEFTITRQQFHDSKYKGNTCPVCFPNQQIKFSVCELEMYNFVKSLHPDAVHGYRKTYHSKEIDAFVPSLNIGFEYNGLYWHSEQLFQSLNKSHVSDALKWKYFTNQGITLIQIFEDEWKVKNRAVLSKITHLLGQTSNKIHARNCGVVQIDEARAHQFLQENALFDPNTSDYWFSLEHRGEIVSVIGFNINELHCDVIDFSIKCFTHIPGAFSKMLNVVKQEYGAETISIGSNKRWHKSNSFNACEFVASKELDPKCWYTKTNFTGRKPTAESIYNVTIWDSGYIVYSWKKT